MTYAEVRRLQARDIQDVSRSRTSPDDPACTWVDGDSGGLSGMGGEMNASDCCVMRDGAKGSPPSLLGAGIVSPVSAPLNLLRREVSRLKNNAEHLLSAAAVLLRFLAESLQQLALNSNGGPVLRGAHLLFLLVHLHTYTLSGQLFHQYSVILSDYLKLSQRFGV